MPEFPSIINQIMGDKYLFWLVIGLATMVLYSMADDNDSLIHARPQYHPQKHTENNGIVQIPVVNEPLQSPTIPISGHLSSHSAPIVPGKYNCSRNSITDTGL